MDFSKSISIQERLVNNAVVQGSELRGFKASDFVVVMNIDDEPYEWEFCTEETIDVDPTGLSSTRTAKVEKFRLEPGQTVEIQGNVAMHLIEGLVKKLIQKEGKAKMINIVSIQDEWINRVFLGKKAPVLPYAMNSVDPDTGTKTYRTPEITKDPIETPFPEVSPKVDTSSLETKSGAQEHILVGRPAKTAA